MTTRAVRGALRCTNLQLSGEWLPFRFTVSFHFVSFLNLASALNLGIYLVTVYQVFFRIIVLLQQNFAG